MRERRGLAGAVAALALVLFSLTAMPAAARSINSVVPPFKLGVGHSLAGARVRLTSLTIRPFDSTYETRPVGGCIDCTGHGRFGPDRIAGDSVVELATGSPLFLTRRSRVVEAVTSPDAIGRFEVFGLAARSSTPRLVLVEAGCTPAGLALSEAQVLRYRTVPEVPCSQRLPGPNRLSMSLPLELSPSGGTQVNVTAHAAGSQWLVVFQGPPGGPCAPNALAEDRRAPHAFAERRISGDFSGSFSSFPTTQTGQGEVCAYLQVGGRLTGPGGDVVPYGRVTSSGRQPFLTGDSLKISGAGSVVWGQQASETVSGYAAVTGEQLYVFAPYSRCASTATAEYSIDSNEYTLTLQRGPFSQALTVTPTPSTAPSTGYVCAYLQSGPPANSVPTGSLILAAVQPIQIQP